ncbi:putative nucleotidyltransferase with HDIG domain [Shewanella putrefaciens]|nr:putative nucleotidyltransferase with HDIG domain [Shewanella putrefaciens]
MSVHQLQIGNFVRLPVAWKDHPFLFSSFHIKQAAQIELIKNLGIAHVIVDLERSDVEPLSIDAVNPIKLPPAPEIHDLKNDMELYKAEQIEVQKKLRRDIHKTEQNFTRSVAMMRSMISKLRNRPLNAVDDAKDLVHSIVEQLLTSDNLVLHLMSDAKQDESIYYHSLNVAILSMLIAKEMEWSRSEIEAIGLSALFHDVGKLKIPPQILKKSTPWSAPELNFIKQHPLLGVELLKLAENFPPSALPAITNHHEFLDGTGYPKGLKEADLDQMSQLLAVVNEYDSLCYPNPQDKPMMSYAALGHLYKQYKTKLNQEYIGKIIKMLGIYPPGSVVELSSGQYAMVMSVNLQKLLCPKILVYDAQVPKDQAPIVDLELEGISIVRCLPPAALPEKVHEYLNPRERVSYYFGGDSRK